MSFDQGRMPKSNKEKNKGSEPRRPKLVWDTYQRQFLCCLYRFFSCSDFQVSAIFSKVFREQLVECGFASENIPYRSLYAQWSWLRRQKRPVWFHVHVTTEFNTEKEWKDIVHLIRCTASDLGLWIHEKREDTISPPEGHMDMDKEAGEYLTSILLVSSPKQQEQNSSGATDDIQESQKAYERSSQVIFGGKRADVVDNLTIPTLVRTHDSHWSIFSPEQQMSPRLGSERTVEATQSGRSHRSNSSSSSQPRGESANYPPTEPSREPHADTLSENSIKSFESLVTGHGKVCFWCAKENITSCASMASTTSSEDSDTVISDELMSLDNKNIIEPEDQPRMPLEIHELGNQSASEMLTARDFGGLEKSPKMPELLYRWSNLHSQGINNRDLLVAGSFVKTWPRIAFPRDISREEFLGLFKAHVTREKVPTPFISAFARPIAPIHRALRNRARAKISIIDPKLILNEVFPAQPLAQITQTLVDRWKGYGEFEIWGFVPREAIVGTMFITELEDIARGDSEIQEYLQLDLIRAEETCHRGLRRNLRGNLRSLSYQDNREALKRVADEVDIPEEYKSAFMRDIHAAWTMNLGRGTQFLDGEEDPLCTQDWTQTGTYERSSQRLVETARGIRHPSESTISYVPSVSDNGSPSDSSSEGDNMSQSPVAAIPRQDTPSPAFSLASDSENSVMSPNLRMPSPEQIDTDMTDVIVLQTQSRTSRYFNGPERHRSRTQSPTLDPHSLVDKISYDDDDSLEDSDWPSEGEILLGNDTPSKCHYLSRPMDETWRGSNADTPHLSDNIDPEDNSLTFTEADLFDV